MYLEKLDPEGSGRFAFLAYDQGLEHGPADFRPNPASASPQFVLELARGLRLFRSRLPAGRGPRRPGGLSGGAPAHQAQRQGEPL